MKLEISLPENLFNDAEITARHLGLTRSHLYAKAIREFIEHHNKDRITKKLSALYSRDEKDEDTTEMNEIGLEALREASRDDSW